METGFVISTYGSPAYIDLQLALHKGRWGHDCIIVDDGSKDPMLQEVCSKWEVPLTGAFDERLGHQKGDAKAYREGIEHFSDKDWIFKISRRFLWLKDFSKELPDSDFSKSPVLSDCWVPNPKWENNRAFTTCCLGIYNKALPIQLKELIRKLPDIVQEPPGGRFVQPALYKLFKAYYQNPLTIWRALYKKRGREEVDVDVLWKNNAQPYRYKLLSDLLNLNWRLQDFQV